MGAVLFVGSVAVSAGACGGSAPMAFKRSIIARRGSALPSTSTLTGKPSIVAITVRRAAGVGCLDWMGVTLLIWLVIRASFRAWYPVSARKISRAHAYSQTRIC